jgi:hemerythrin-like metal-binding protein
MTDDMAVVTAVAQPAWTDAMTVGNAGFDAQRRDLMGLIEELNTNPRGFIRAEYFLGKLSMLHVVVEEYFAREEALMDDLGVPAAIKDIHVEQHRQLSNLFNDIHLDPKDPNHMSARETYNELRSAIQTHMLEFDGSLYVNRTRT